MPQIHRPGLVGVAEREGDQQPQAVVGVLRRSARRSAAWRAADRADRACSGIRSDGRRTSNVWHIATLSTITSIASPVSGWVKYSCLLPYSALKLRSAAYPCSASSCCQRPAARQRARAKSRSCPVRVRGGSSGVSSRIARPPISRSTTPCSSARSMSGLARSSSEAVLGRRFPSSAEYGYLLVRVSARALDRSRAKRLRGDRRGAATSWSRSPPTLIGFDTTARDVGDPPRDEAALQEYLADAARRRRGRGRPAGSPTPTRCTASRWCPPGLDFAGRPS